MGMLCLGLGSPFLSHEYAHKLKWYLASKEIKSKNKRFTSSTTLSHISLKLRENHPFLPRPLDVLVALSSIQDCQYNYWL